MPSGEMTSNVLLNIINIWQLLWFKFSSFGGLGQFSLKCLPNKDSDLDFDPQHSHQIPRRSSVFPWLHCRGGRKKRWGDRQVLGLPQPASLAQSASSICRRDPASKKKVESSRQRDPGCPRTTGSSVSSWVLRFRTWAIKTSFKLCPSKMCNFKWRISYSGAD